MRKVQQQSLILSATKAESGSWTVYAQVMEQDTGRIVRTVPETCAERSGAIAKTLERLSNGDFVSLINRQYDD